MKKNLKTSKIGTEFKKKLDYYMELYGIIWNYMALHGIIWNYMGLCGIIWICLPAQRSSLPMVANLPMRDLRGPEGRPAPSVAVVHNPYAFRGYDLVLVLRTPPPGQRPSPHGRHSKEYAPEGVHRRHLVPAIFLEFSRIISSFVIYFLWIIC